MDAVRGSLKGLRAKGCGTRIRRPSLAIGAWEGPRTSTHAPAPCANRVPNVPRTRRARPSQLGGRNRRNAWSHAGFSVSCRHSPRDAKPLGVDCHAGGRGFESRRSRSSKMPASLGTAIGIGEIPTARAHVVLLKPALLAPRSDLCLSHGVGHARKLVKDRSRFSNRKRPSGRPFAASEQSPTAGRRRRAARRLRPLVRRLR